MKINEIVTEGIASTIGKGVGAVARGAGAVVGGVAGLPGAFKQGYQAGKTTVSGQPAAQAQGSVVQQAPGFKGMPIQPNTNAQKYMQDIGSAIKAGAAGDISAKSASATDAESARAPVGTKVGTWTKTSDGWVDQNNVAANPTQAKTLDKKWYTDTQQQMRQQAGQKQQTAAQAKETAPTWDAKKKILTKDGVQYKKTTKGWQDIATDELIEPKYAAEIQAAFDQASGRAPVAGQTTQQSQTAQPGPDVSNLTQAEKAELIRQVKQKLGQAE